MRNIELPDVVVDFAAGLQAADALRPQASSFRSTRLYAPGIGPHGENRAVALILEQMTARRPELYDKAGPIMYPGTRQRCDLGLGKPLTWAIEIKMARAYGDNGKLDDTYLKDLLSPYAADRSAVADSAKLSESAFNARRAVLIYGFDYPNRPLDPAIEALEMLMQSRTELGPRATAGFSGLVHPVHAAGRVFAWEVKRATTS